MPPALGHEREATQDRVTASSAGVPGPGADPAAVVAGGANDGFKALPTGRLTAAGFQVVDGDDAPAPAGTRPDNIANRTLPAGGGQLELTTELRNAMPGTSTRAGLKSSTTAVFWDFAGAVRQSIALLEAAQAA